MKLTAATVITLLHQSSAFTPGAFTRLANTRSNKFTHSAIVDPTILSDAHQHVDTLANFFSSVMISDADTIADVAASAASVATDAVAPAVSAVVDAVPDAATDVAAAGNDNGWFGFLEGPIEFLLVGIHGLLGAVGITGNAWGISIITMTLIIKLVTYPLTVQQTESTTKMQMVAPKVKEIQAKYQSNPEVMNQKISAIYQENNVNPLAGCLPIFLTIPVFIGLYRAVLTLAKDNQLDESFLWLPNLEGPVYGADPGIGWLTDGWVNGAPSLGWEDTLSFLSIPVLLVISQVLSLNLMAPKDQEQPGFTKFLPLLIGYFSLTVPAGLGIYWIANNIITTALTLQIRNSIKVADPVSSGSGSAAVSNAIDVPATFTPAPMREKPAGFGASDWSDDGDAIKPITPVDAEVIESSTEEVVATPVATAESSKKKKKRGGKKNRKKKKN